jgi:hypothetical protein
VSWIGNLDVSEPGKTWRETSTEDYGATVFHHWRCYACRRTAVTAGERAPSACCCQGAKK